MHLTYTNAMIMMGRATSQPRRADIYPIFSGETHAIFLNAGRRAQCRGISPGCFSTTQ
jgi:hypothetical protein